MGPGLKKDMLKVARCLLKPEEGFYDIDGLRGEVFKDYYTAVEEEVILKNDYDKAATMMLLN